MTDSVRHFVFPLERLDGELERLTARLGRLARDLHRDPEPAGEERRAVSRIAGELEEEGFAIELGLAGLPTAFRAQWGAAEHPAVAFLAEYDAIPGLGHAAGHPLLTMVSCGAAMACVRALDPARARVVVIGAPAEETFGGKIVLARHGVFDQLDAVLLAHPAPHDRVVVKTLASWSMEVVFEGRSAHAVASPDTGVNALDAVIRLFAARDRLLQQCGPEIRMPGVILEGGVRPNLVPDRARARFSLRAPSGEQLYREIAPRFRAIVAEVAAATGATARVTPVDNLYDELISNPVLAEIYGQALQAIGQPVEAGEGEWIGSLDIGTASHAVPVLHPSFSLGADTPSTHTAEFAERAQPAAAWHCAVQAIRALACTAMAVLTDESVRLAVRSSHLPATSQPVSREIPLITSSSDR